MTEDTTMVNYEIPVRKRSTLKCILLFLFTLGYYKYVWLWKTIKDINNLGIAGVKKLNYWLFATGFILIDLGDIFNFLFAPETEELYTSWDRFSMNISGLIMLFACFAIVKHIRMYTDQRYNVCIKPSGVFTFLFTMFYVNFVLNSYSDRVAKAAKLK